MATGPVPVKLVAATVKKTGPLLKSRSVKRNDVSPQFVLVWIVVPCRAVTVYDVTGVPPSATGAFQESVAVPSRRPATAVRSVGAAGLVQICRSIFLSAKAQMDPSGIANGA